MEPSLGAGEAPGTYDLYVMAWKTSSRKVLGSVCHGQPLLQDTRLLASRAVADNLAAHTFAQKIGNLLFAQLPHRVGIAIMLE